MSGELLKKAIDSFVGFLCAQTGEDVNVGNMRFVWQVKCLQNYKYIITNLEVPGYIAELTYNGDKGELYVDCYCKMWNDVIKEKEESK